MDSKDENTPNCENKSIDKKVQSVAEPGKRKRREIYLCPHTDRQHYAKNMCHNCYHRKGKSKMAYACGHFDRSHYSRGMCQNCYLSKYYIQRKDKKLKKLADKKTKTNQEASEADMVQQNESQNLIQDQTA